MERANSLDECVSVWEARKLGWDRAGGRVYPTALLKGGGLEDIHPGLSLPWVPWVETLCEHAGGGGP